MDLALQEKKDRLLDLLRETGGCVIGFSGGVDSTFLFAVAAAVLGQKALAVTASSETYPERELREARELAEKIGGRHRVIVSEELDIPGFAENPKDRCYHCKKELFSKLRAVAEEEGLPQVLDGSNVDDRGDYRPGRRALRELDVRSPLEEAGLSKADIRELSRELGLPTWDKPAFACLSSRFPYGTRITREKVTQVGRAEESLRELGLRVLRVRHHGDVARLELGADEFGRVVNGLRDEVVRRVKEAGYVYVALDLQGYRTGAMNETLTDLRPAVAP
ncbi:MAG: ATP-dependent sacrificial sulfur transferase LarE [Deltaproteobacteria bacterium]|nr:ATP-dependent sacrificial sulfur transferase LarE [Deltaproteobacteria bacterium]